MGAGGLGAHKGRPYGGSGEGFEESFEFIHGGRVAGGVGLGQGGMSGVGLGYGGGMCEGETTHESNLAS